MVHTFLVLLGEISRKLSEKVVTQQVIYSSNMATLFKIPRLQQKMARKKNYWAHIPPRSPDINLIENMFNLIDKKF